MYGWMICEARIKMEKGEVDFYAVWSLGFNKELVFVLFKKMGKIILRHKNGGE